MSVKATNPLDVRAGDVVRVFTGEELTIAAVEPHRSFYNAGWPLGSWPLPEVEDHIVKRGSWEEHRAMVRSLGLDRQDERDIRHSVSRKLIASQPGAYLDLHNSPETGRYLGELRDRLATLVAQVRSTINQVEMVRDQMLALAEAMKVAGESAPSAGKAGS